VPGHPGHDLGSLHEGLSDDESYIGETAMEGQRAWELDAHWLPQFPNSHDLVVVDSYTTTWETNIVGDIDGA
jgi:hypothetical protein